MRENCVFGSLVIILVTVLGLSGCGLPVKTEIPLLDVKKAHDVGVTALAFDPEGGRVVTGGFWGDIIIWAVPEGEKLVTLDGHDKAVRGFVWLTADTLISADDSGAIILWRVNDAREFKKVSTVSPIKSICQLPQRNLLVTGHEDGYIRTFSLPGLVPSYESDIHSPIRAIAADKEKQYIAVSTEDGKVHLLDAKLHMVMELEKPPTDAFELRFSPDGKILAGGTWFKLLLWDVDDGKLTIRETEHWGAVHSVDFSPDGNYLATLGRHTDSQIRLVEMKSNKVVRRLKRHMLCGAMIRFCPDGRYVASASDDESFRLYDLAQ